MSDDVEKSKGGRKPHEPTEENRKMVSCMTAYGLTQGDICAVLDIDGKTLRKHYRVELDTAKPRAITKVADKLYEKALGGDTTSIMFYLKTQGRWSETQKHEVGGDGDNPVQINITRRIVDPVKLDDDAGAD